MPLDLSKPLQNGTGWMIELCDFNGSRIIPPIDNPLWFWTSNAVNAVGGWMMALPGTMSKQLFKKDYRMKFWRKPVGGAMYLEHQGFIRVWENPADEYGAITRIIGGPGLNYLASGRVVAYRPTTSQADKTGAADDLIKAYGLENLGASAGTGRVISSALFSIAGNVTQGQSLTRAASFKNLLDLWRELSDASRALGTEIYFDIVPAIESPSASTFELRTYTGQRGIDRSGNSGLTFSLENGNLFKPSSLYDATDEFTDVYGLGRGDDTTLDVQQAQDAARSTYSPFSRREGIVRATNADSAAVLAKAQAAVANGRPRNRFTGQLLSVPGYIYGKDWGFGDKLNALYDDEQYTIMARAAKCNVSTDGVETIEVTAEAYQ